MNSRKERRIELNTTTSCGFNDNDHLLGMGETIFTKSVGPESLGILQQMVTHSRIFGQNIFFLKF